MFIYVHIHASFVFITAVVSEYILYDLCYIGQGITHTGFVDKTILLF